VASSSCSQPGGIHGRGLGAAEHEHHLGQQERQGEERGEDEDRVSRPVLRGLAGLFLGAAGGGEGLAA
jgi:hypothetical protein